MFNQYRIYLAFLGCVILGTGCANIPPSNSWSQSQTTALRDQLLQLGRTVDADEASRLAESAVKYSRVLAQQYRVVRPAWLHNVLVNAGWRERGLCYEWTIDLFPHLHELNLKSLELHLAVARMDTSREHNTIIVTAEHQPFAQGVVLDAWRHSGRLWFGSAATDKYPWQSLPRDRVAPELENLVAK